MALENRTNSFILITIAMTIYLVSLPRGSAAIKPLVEIGESKLSPEGTHVGINVPLILSLSIDTRGRLKGLQMDESILSGLVRVQLDLAKPPDGGLPKGPVKVSVAGVTVYNNLKTPPT